MPNRPESRPGKQEAIERRPRRWLRAADGRRHLDQLGSMSAARLPRSDRGGSAAAGRRGCAGSDRAGRRCATTPRAAAADLAAARPDTIIVERRQPVRLRRRVFGVRAKSDRAACPIRTPPCTNAIELGMRQLRHDLDAHAGCAFERGNRVVERVVHRPADERGATRLSVARAWPCRFAIFRRSSRRRSSTPIR